MQTLGKFRDFKVNCDKISEIAINNGILEIFTEIEMDKRPDPDNFPRYEITNVEEINPVYFKVTAKLKMSETMKEQVLKAAAQYRFIENDIRSINNTINGLEERKRKLSRDKWVWIEEV